jgi:tRNA A37 threonylcarbamoyladenosine synthetase subunit TsaC/SUA5/YrdC
MRGDLIYLAQSDTTAGLLSQNREKLNLIKERDKNKPVLREVDSLDTLKKFTRVPRKFKNRIRRSKKVTFIYPNKEALRVVRDELHLGFLRKFKWMYSTSANKSGKRFDKEWAKSVADIVVEDRRGLFEGEASRIYKISKRKIKRVR